MLYKKIQCVCEVDAYALKKTNIIFVVFVWGKKWFFYLTEHFLFFSCVVKINKIIYCHGSQCSAPCSSLKSYKWIILCFLKCSHLFLYDWFHFFTHETIYYWILHRTKEIERERTCGIDFYHYFSMLPYGRFICSAVSLLKRWI